MIKAAHISDSVFGSPAILKAFASLALSTLFFILMYAGGVSPVMSAVLAGLVLVCCLAAVYFPETAVRFLRTAPRSAGYTETDGQPESDTIADTESPRLSARELLPRDLKEAGMQPEWDDDTLIFRFQGGYFRAVNLDNEVIRIVYPRIYSVNAASQDLLCRLLNRINSDYALVRLIATAVPEKDDIEVYAFADIYYTDAVSNRMMLLATMLSIFFDAQRSLVLSASLNSAIDSEGANPECETAYRGFSLN